MLPIELGERFVPLIDMLDEAIARGERALAGGDASPFRQRIAAAFLGDAADENADDVAVLLRNTTLVREALLHILGESGVQRFDAMGETYVRERHEVLEHREAGQDWVGRVLQELRPGYLHEGRVIRRAQVVLGRPAM